jgi:hypothetical protein
VREKDAVKRGKRKGVHVVTSCVCVCGGVHRQSSSQAAVGMWPAAHLPQRVGMAIVHHVKAAVHVHAHRTTTWWHMRVSGCGSEVWERRSRRVRAHTVQMLTEAMADPLQATHFAAVVNTRPARVLASH